MNAGSVLCAGEIVAAKHSDQTTSSGLSNRPINLGFLALPIINKKATLRVACFIDMAEREGFEPSEPAKVHLISNQAHSASSGTSPFQLFCHALITTTTFSFLFSRQEYNSHVCNVKLYEISPERYFFPKSC